MMTAEDQIRDLQRNIARATLRKLVDLPVRFGVSNRNGFVLVGKPNLRVVKPLPPEMPAKRIYSASIGCGVSVMCLSAWVYLSVQLVAS